MKTCFKCEAYLPLSEFYKHSAMADGHLNKCKLCTKNDANAHREENLERIRRYDRERGKLPHRIQKRKEYAAKNPEKISAIGRAWRDRNPEKRRAHSAVNNAIRNGKVQRPKICDVCRKPGRIHAHHDNYTKPLNVRWLCAECHSDYHARVIRKGKGLKAYLEKRV